MGQRSCSKGISKTWSGEWRKSIFNGCYYVRVREFYTVFSALLETSKWCRKSKWLSNWMLLALTWVAKETPMLKLLQILRRVTHVLPKLQLQGEFMFANSLIDVSFPFFFFSFSQPKYASKLGQNWTQFD